MMLLQVQRVIREERAREAERQRREREIAAAIKSHNESVKQKQNASATTAPSSSAVESTSSAPARGVNTSYVIEKPAHAAATTHAASDKNASKADNSDSYVNVTSLLFPSLWSIL